jgi:hypothetical protein
MNWLARDGLKINPTAAKKLCLLFMFHVVQALYNYEMHALKEENKKRRPARNNLYLKTTRRFIFMYIQYTYQSRKIQFLLNFLSLRESITCRM